MTEKGIGSLVDQILRRESRNLRAHILWIIRKHEEWFSTVEIGH